MKKSRYLFKAKLLKEVYLEMTLQNFHVTTRTRTLARQITRPTFYTSCSNKDGLFFRFLFPKMTSYQRIYQGLSIKIYLFSTWGVFFNYSFTVFRLRFFSNYRGFFRPGAPCIWNDCVPARPMRKSKNLVSAIAMCAEIFSPFWNPISQPGVERDFDSNTRE